MDRILVIVDQAILRLLAVLLALVTLGIFVQVVLRYAAGASFLWGEELSVFAFVWCIFLGAVLNVRRRSNFAFEFFADLLPGRWSAVQRLIVDAIVLACCLVLLREGLAFSELSIKRLSPALGISLFVPTLAIPVASFLMILAVLIHMARNAAILLGREG
ncbi:TRAP transporter small permease [Nitratireductor mangrovi]|uniref:TRAP transporter small permease protein n=1 Tax=Nitratireductor mangrovi TaxID=2599600 RepID=A0A5B8L093_9HYPH|nr:TRAP transporter small permease [Nitratireductor mangrovi]QDZ01345.1 TRAP transporter small permease [Nitratireductor mangrovi]